MAEISPNWNALYSNQGIRLQGNPVLDGLRQQVAQRQQQQQKDNDNFTSEIAKLNFGGAKDSDVADLQKQYRGVVGTFGKLRNTTDPAERSQLDLQLQQQKNAFGYNVEKSKAANADFMKKSALAHDPNHQVTQAYYDDMNKGKTLSSFSPEYQEWMNRGSDWFSPKWDALKQADQIFKIATNKGEPVVAEHIDPQTGQKVQSSTTTPKFNRETGINEYINSSIKDPDSIREAESVTGLKGVDALHKRASDLADVYEQGLSTAYSNDKNLGLTWNSRNKINDMSANKEIEVAKKKAALGIGSSAQQPTPLQVAATPLQQAFKTNPEVGKQQFDKMILPHLPTKGMEEPITTSIDNGQFVIHIPDKRTGAKSVVPEHEVRVDINDPYWGSNLQTKLQQEGMNVSDFNQSYKGGKTKIESTQSKLPRQVKSDEDYKSLPRGEQYVAPNGKVYIKK